MKTQNPYRMKANEKHRPLKENELATPHLPAVGLLPLQVEYLTGVNHFVE
jgi:hypothetical protein